MTINQLAAFAVAFLAVCAMGFVLNMSANDDIHLITQAHADYCARVDAHAIDPMLGHRDYLNKCE